MIRVLLLSAFWSFALSLQAEYDRNILYLKITVDYPNFSGGRIYKGYFPTSETREGYSDYSLEKWKNLLCRWGYENGKSALLYHNLLTYNIKPLNPAVEFGGTHYKLKDTFSVKVFNVLKVEVINVFHEFLLSGIHSNLELEDSVWFNKPFVHYEEFSPVIPMCEDCEGELVQAYTILIHEESERINWVIERLRAMEELFAQRIEDIEMYYGYLDKSSPEYQGILHTYGPALVEFLTLLENEKVVIVMDSGW